MLIIRSFTADNMASSFSDVTRIAHPLGIPVLQLILLCSSFFAVTRSSYELTDALRSLTVPHNCVPGYVITTVGYVGQTMTLESSLILPSDKTFLCQSSLSDCNNVTELFAVLNNGEIITISDISMLLNKELRLRITSQLTTESWKEEFLIHVRDGNSMLIFSQTMYEGRIVEKQPPFSVVQELEVLEATVSNDPHAKIRYSIIDGPLDVFEIVQLSVYDHPPLIRTLVDLDFEEETQYSLIVMASTEHPDDQPAFAKVIIYVENVNDNFPVMDQPVYSAFFSDGLPTGSHVLSVHASDADFDKVEYHLEDSSDLFGIHSNNGSIYLLQPSGDIFPTNYTVRVFAMDADRKRTGSVVVNLISDTILKSSGLKSPPFPVEYNSLTSESDPIRTDRKRRETRPTKIVEIPESFISGDLLDLDNNYYEVFTFKDPVPKMLELNPTLGSVKLRPGEKFDYEVQKEVDFVIQITRVDNPAYLEEQPVKIRISDVNDELPEFMNVPRPFLTTVTTNAASGTSIYQLMAQDIDQDSVVRYTLESGGEDRFEVDAEVGVVRTKGGQPFRLGKEFEIGVSAYDASTKALQKSATHSLKILVGEREPQFYETLYIANVPETAGEQYEIIEIKAFSHQGYPLTYELTTDSGAQSNEFAIEQETGVVDLLRSLDYEKDSQQHHLRVKVIENGRPTRTSTVNLIINVIDMNDNVPTFPLSQYIVQGIAETVAVGTDIIQVIATDLDSVTNSQLTYSVSDNSFTVQTLNNIGYVKTAKRLDYDNIPDHTYNFTIVATDNGSPAHSGSAMLRVSVTNVNDEDPVFMQSIEHVQVSEDAPLNTVVHVIQSYDPDGDDVTYSFGGGRLSDGPFKIDPRSGIITLVGALDKARISYRLNVTAADNGRCCGGTTSRHSRGVVVIEIKDINNNAPKFPHCANYTPVVMEKENLGTPVIQVKAIDGDTGPNGNVTYSLVKSNDQSSDRFDIDPITGIIRTADVFDREAQIGVTDYGVTVKAEDQGTQTLAGFCTFRVKIGDVNDNPPVFNLPQYSTSIEERSMVGKRVKQVYATDRDAGENGKVEYFLKDDPSGFFAINQVTGWVTVARPMSGRDQVTIEIEARDKGVSTKSTIVRMDIEITQTINAYPQWDEDYSAIPVRLSENSPVNTVVKRLKATSNMPDSLVTYIIQPGETADQNGQPRSFYHRIHEQTNDMILLTYKPLDYEALPQYTLTIKATNRATNSLHNDTRLTIDLIDENDEIPQFIGLDENGRYPGSVAENLEPGAEVITVTATDKDEFVDFKRIYYRIKEVGVDYDKFSINRQTGLITSVASFDREVKNEYYVTVIAEDGAPSDRPNHYPPGTPNQGEAEVQIRVTDMNDNTPYFKERVYTARVPENTDPGAVIMTVNAEDKDEENRLTYSITHGNVGNAFEVVPDLGEIKVRGQLDYENGPREYRLTYRVFDDKYANTTVVIIQVLDVNDNPPRFDNAIYNVTDVTEEEQGISKNNPKYLLTVRATDPDIDRNAHIRYSLTGQFADDGTFIINEHTGETYLTRALDRDQSRGRPVWNFNVLAHDEPDPIQPSLTGYAEVRVIPKDINDNAPVFDRNRLVGKIPEHSRAGMTVLTVIATDADNGNNGSVSYSLKQVPMKGSQPLFSIDSHMGLISTIVNNALDRETQDEYKIIVQAKDRGSPPMSSSATVTITIDDINDHAPKFTQSVFQATMSESFQKGTSITSVSATDLDIGSNAKLTYTLKEQDREHFYISSIEATNTGVLKVFKPVDYDSMRWPNFTITVHVQDTDPGHIDTAYIEIKVTDFNDNPPQFLPSTKKVPIFENVTVGTTLFKFSATDKDTGPNKEFTFSIDRQTDTERQFSVDNIGLVTTAKALDRETVPQHRVHILAIDKGYPPQTGTGTLIVSLTDVNDNFPEFATDYRPVIYEKQAPGQAVVEISAVDRDMAINGPPFEFWLPCSGACPCNANPACSDFSFKFVPGGGDNGYGKGIVTSSKEFDREEKKEYHLPIIMKDNGHPPTSGTNTLTIIIGDVNDNLHHPGHKNIFVYSYKGEFENMVLGNVYAKDEDDWDVVDKIFTFVNPKDTQKFFRLDSESGQLSTKGRLLKGEYHFQVKVYDSVWKRAVVSTVTVTVKEINDDAIYNSGSIRIHGIEAEAFVTRPKSAASGPEEYGPSKYEVLKGILAKKLHIPFSNVDIFTVRNHPTLLQTIDIRYAAHGSPYYRSSRLDGVMLNNKNEIEKHLGVSIVMIPIDECLHERCESGGCSNRLITSSEPLLINTNETSIIGIMAYIQAECRCAARTFASEEPDECRPDSCLNDGTCVQRNTGFECICLPGFDGPRCQQTRHGFTGDGWAWYKPLAQCEDSHTSLEFITTKENGLILYNGPMMDTQEGEREDFIILELRTGYPFLRINHGSGERQLIIDGIDKNGEVRLHRLNDGRWHRVDIIRLGKNIRMVVDRCEMARVIENESVETSVEDRRACEVTGDTPGDRKYLNVNTPLQLGGRSNPKIKYPQNVFKDGFNGCVKNLVHNGELYDLHIGKVGEHKNSHDGCHREDAICGTSQDDLELTSAPKCGPYGDCIGTFHHNFTCVCQPGWRGHNCATSTTVKDFQARSFIEWDLHDKYYAELDKHGAYKTELQLMFRTRRESGLLFKAQNAQKSEYIILEVVGYNLRFRYNLGSGEQHLALSALNVSDGSWHTAKVLRVGQWAELKVDGGEGRYFNETWGISGAHVKIRYSQRSLFAGGDVRFPSSNTPPLVDHDFENGCMNDIRFDGRWFPMEQSQNRESSAAEFLSRSQNIADSCVSDMCNARTGLTCMRGLLCIDLWRHAECRCPTGKRLSMTSGDSDLCVNINECLENTDLCYYGVCHDTEDGYTCECHSGYGGPTCMERREAATVFVSTSAVLTIIICALVVMLLILLFTIYSRRRRPASYATGLDPNDDVRENRMLYQEDGVGEEDQDAYDINKLTKVVGNNIAAAKANGGVKRIDVPQLPDPRSLQDRGVRSLDDIDVGLFINSRLRCADTDANAPPYDSVREYAYEGAGSTSGSLSSLASISDGEDGDKQWDHLNNWGPRFEKLADMYRETTT